MKALYLDPKPGKVYFGDQDGHVYVVARNGATANGVEYNGFPMRPSGGGSTDPFVTAPVYVTGLGGANAGVIAIGSSTGKVFFFIDQKNTAMTPAPALIRMYHVGSAVSALAYRATNSSSGTFLVSTANGKTFYIDSADVVDRLHQKCHGHFAHHAPTRPGPGAAGRQCARTTGPAWASTARARASRRSGRGRCSGRPAGGTRCRS